MSWVGVSQKTGFLLGESRSVGKREFTHFFIAFLLGEDGEIYCPAIHTHGCAGFQLLHLETHLGKLVGESYCRLLANASGGERGLAYMYASVEESAVGKYNGVGTTFQTHFRAHSCYGVSVHGNGHYLVLPKREIGGVFEKSAPEERELHFVALCAGAPHGGTLGEVEHAELYHGVVGNNSRVAAEGVDFAHYLTFGHATHGGVARHLTDGVEVLGDEEGVHAEVGRSGGGLSTGMSSANNNYIVTAKNHRFLLFVVVYLVYLRHFSNNVSRETFFYIWTDDLFEQGLTPLPKFFRPFGAFRFFQSVVTYQCAFQV